ncbi:histidine kinase [Paractinoplanes toevensis]|uniref:histidine kinase n=1 Tax=Paractinoplanes toevensis TaxID=571911 RepID=A0A919TIM1_9ACTN|nr:histidine kinase [Actinoplanes toevensis]
MGYLLTTGPVTIAASVPILLLGLPWAILIRRVAAWDDPSFVQLALLLLGGAMLFAVFGPLVAMPVAAVERRRLPIVDTRPVRSGHRPVPAGDVLRWLRTRYTEAATWRELCYTVLLTGAVPVWYGAVLILMVLIGVSVASPFLVHDHAPISLGLGEVSTVGEALPYALFGAALMFAVPYLLALLAGSHAAVARLLLAGPDDTRLRAELIEVSRSRARLVDAFEAERHRIERDLHDGAQQRLVSLTLQLGLARVDLPDDSPARQAVTAAHEQAKMLMAELRELIHGIRPQTLTEVGLPGALRELADQAPIPVTVRVDLSGRPPPGVELVAYFVAAEALTNVFKHSEAVAATLTVSAAAAKSGDVRPAKPGPGPAAAEFGHGPASKPGHGPHAEPSHGPAAALGDVLVVEVLDDGRGGADPARGTGLTGLADRVAVADGRMFLSSPPGGPTLIRVEIPCRPNDRSA